MATKKIKKVTKLEAVKVDQVELTNGDVYKLLHSSLFADLVGRSEWPKDNRIKSRSGIKKLFVAIIKSHEGEAYREMMDELKKPHAEAAKTEFEKEAQAEFDKKVTEDEDAKLQKINVQQIDLAADNRLSETTELEEFLKLSFGLSVEKVPIVIDNDIIKVSIQQEANHDWIFDFTTKG